LTMRRALKLRLGAQLLVVSQILRSLNLLRVLYLVA
jgi:hypothetical protein